MNNEKVQIDKNSFKKHQNSSNEQKNCSNEIIKKT